MSMLEIIIRVNLLYIFPTHFQQMEKINNEIHEITL